MTTTANPYFDLTHPDAGPDQIVLVTTWRVGDQDRQRRVADAIAATWHDRPWPWPQLLDWTVLGSINGNTLLNYLRLSGSDTVAAREQRESRWQEIDKAVPGIERLGGREYRHYRSVIGQAAQQGHSDQPPGCYVMVRAQFSEPNGRRWVDNVFAVSARVHRPTPGLIGAHFHLSSDDRHVLNLAEWTDEQAHRRLVDTPGGAVRDAVNLFPGRTRVSFERFRLLLRLDH